MRAKELLIVLGLVTCLFSTSFAQSDNNQKVNPADPNLAMNSQGAPGSHEQVINAFCRQCELKRLAQLRMQEQTAAQASSSGPSSNDNIEGTR